MIHRPSNLERCHLKHLLLCASVLALGTGADSAVAVHFAPEGARFKLSGTLAMSKSPSKEGFGCPFVFTGNVTQGELEITKANFCKGVQAGALPWTWIATGVMPKTAMAIMAFSIKTRICGSTNDQIFVQSGNFDFGPATSLDNCIIGGGSAMSVPLINIKP
jgi:hypothetical protein